MDIRMPELDGLQATRRILATDHTARILILTTFDLDEYVYEALRAGASGFVLKDDSPEQLIAAIARSRPATPLLAHDHETHVIQKFAARPGPRLPKELDDLSEREREVFRLMARGLSNGEIAQELYISETTVKTHVTHPPEAQPPRPCPGGRACLPVRDLRSGRAAAARQRGQRDRPGSQLTDRVVHRGRQAVPDPVP